MEHVWSWLKGAFAVLGGALGWIVEDLKGIFYALLAFVITDYGTGFITAASRKELSSTVGFTGITKKLMMFFLVGLAHIIFIYCVDAVSTKTP